MVARYETMKKFFQDFKKFIARGNILDMAVGVIVGGAFSKIVSSLVNDMLMPVIAYACGGHSVADLKWVWKPAVVDASGVVISAEAALHYGSFIQAIIDFLLIALCLFVILRIAMSVSRRLHRNPDGYTFEEEIALRRSGKTRREVKLMEAAKIAQAEEDRKNAPKPETTDDILKDIRTLLQSQKQSNE